MLSKLLLALGVLAAASAQASPLVFDFETGVGGWSLGTVQRVGGAPLGGEYAIYGSGTGTSDVEFGAPGPSMSIQLDLTGYGSMTYSQLHVSPEDPFRNFVSIFISPVGDACAVFCQVGGTSLFATPGNPSPNPDGRFIDLSQLQGMHTISFVWITGNGIPYSGYVDDISFHPVPEPSTAPLLLLGFAALAFRRRSPSELALVTDPASASRRWPPG